MTLIKLITFLAMSAGTLILLKLSPFELIENIATLLQRRKPTLKEQILLVTKPKKLRGIRRVFQETKQVLKLTDRTNKLSSLMVFSFTLFIIGMCIAASLDNLYLLPILAIGLALLPFLYVLLTASKFKKQLNNDLESTLSSITSSYIRNEDFITAVRENLSYMNSPLIGIFQRFLNRVELIDPDVVAALEDMKSEIENSIFHEWLNECIRCQKNRDFKNQLLPIVAKFSDIQQVSLDVDYELYTPLKEFICMSILVIINFPLLRFLNIEWFNIVMFTTPGKLLLCVIVCFILFSSIQVTRLTKPVEYRR